MRLTYVIVLFVAGFYFVGCGAKPAGNGLCELKCTNARIGGRELQIQSTTEAQKIKCQSANPQTPQTFNIELNFVLVDVDPKPANVGGKEVNVQTPKETTVGAVAFRPGIYSGDGAILTPEEDWCTDSCGVASFQFRTRCQDQTISAGIQTGSIGKSVAIEMDDTSTKEAN